MNEWIIDELRDNAFWQREDGDARTSKLLNAAADLIEQQEAKIKKLRMYKSLYEDLKAENLETIKCINKAIAMARVEAIKEFAETLWDRLICNAEVTYDLPDDFCVDVFDKNETASIIDNLIKEMTKGENNAEVEE